MSPSVTTWCNDQKRIQKLRTLPPARLNDGLGAGSRIVTIESLNQGLNTWKRKMGTKIEDYNIIDLDKAILLLEPFADLLETLRSMREKKTARILQ